MMTAVTQNQNADKGDGGKVDDDVDWNLVTAQVLSNNLQWESSSQKVYSISTVGGKEEEGAEEQDKLGKARKTKKTCSCLWNVLFVVRCCYFELRLQFSTVESYAKVQIK